MKNSIRVVISAPSGAGKTTIINRLLEKNNNFRFSVSTTTRKPRRGEINGESYIFVTDDEFRNMIRNDDFIEWAEVHGHFYGTTKKEIDRIEEGGHIPIFDVDVQGGRALRKKLDNGVFIFIIPPSIEILEKRLRNRKTDSEKNIRLRLKNAIKELKEFDIYDYIIINDQIDDAVYRLESIVAAEQCKKERIRSIISTFGGEDDNTT